MVSIVRITKDLFNEMLLQSKPLLQSNGGCGKSQLQDQFRNIPVKTIDDFINTAIAKGIIKEEPPGTFKLRSDRK